VAKINPAPIDVSPLDERFTVRSGRAASTRLVCATAGIATILLHPQVLIGLLIRDLKASKPPAESQLRAIRWQLPDPRFVLAAMQPLLGLDEMAVIALLSATFWEHLAPSNPELTPERVLGLAMVSAMLPVAYRRLVSRVSCGNGKPLIRAFCRSALSTGAAASTVLLFCAILLPTSASDALAGWAVGWAVTVSFAAGALHSVVAQAVEQTGASIIRAVIVCDPDRVHDLSWAAARMHGWNWFPCYDVNKHENLGDLVDLARRGLVDVIVFDASSVPSPSFNKLTDGLAEIPVRVCIALEAQSLGATLPSGGLLLADLAINPLRPTQAALKRTMDIFLSLTALVVTLPVLCLSAVAICCETKGPVIFSQWRCGLGGVPFRIYKFRTMFIDECDQTSEQQTLRNDPRITRVGRLLRRTSIDELPQLFNVLSGEMSLVGPRAHPVHMKIDGITYSQAVSGYSIRHRTKPGITGWAQVNGSRGGIRTVTRARQRVEFDLFYLQNWSVFFDLEIMLRTVCGGFIAPREQDELPKCDASSHTAG
jgi:exopolysaccharide biosynthesis polyprenyl glycosylphosphotransferase